MTISQTNYLKPLSVYYRADVTTSIVTYIFIKRKFPIFSPYVPYHRKLHKSELWKAVLNIAIIVVITSTWYQQDLFGELPKILYFRHTFNDFTEYLPYIMTYSRKHEPNRHYTLQDCHILVFKWVKPVAVFFLPCFIASCVPLLKDHQQIKYA